MQTLVMDTETTPAAGREVLQTVPERDSANRPRRGEYAMGHSDLFLRLLNRRTASQTPPTCFPCSGRE